MPTYDPNEEAVKQKFGDKSKSRYSWNVNLFIVNWDGATGNWH